MQQNSFYKKYNYFFSIQFDTRSNYLITFFLVYEIAIQRIEHYVALSYPTIRTFAE